MLQGGAGEGPTDGRAAPLAGPGRRRAPPDRITGRARNWGEGGQKRLLQALKSMDGTVPTILVVEDNRATRTFLADNLTADGYELLEAACAGDALDMLEGAFPDLAIVDLGLPDRDGLDLLQQVRDADRVLGRIDPDLPILVLSGRATELDRLRGFDRGCDDYLIKPFSY